MLNPGDRKLPATIADITFAVDNGCFAANWEPDRWLRALDRYLPLQAHCLFAVVPDVVADADATRIRWERWAPVVRGLGYRTAYVAQDGLALSEIPWDELDVWFTGGSTEWKLSAEAHEAAVEARAHGKWTHLGRCNSLRRLRYARDTGYDSADGTFVAFGPDVNLPKVLGWVTRLHNEPSLPLAN